MTEADWLAATDPLPMLDFLRARGGASDRKLRLYFCGGCRRIAHLFFRPESLAVVEVAERFADGAASKEELGRAEWEAEEPTFGYEFDARTFPDGDPYRTRVVPRLVEMGVLPASALAGSAWRVSEPVRERLLAAAELAWWCAAESYQDGWGLRFLSAVDWPGRWLADCVFGNPFRFDPRIAPAVLAWNGGTVPKLAAAMYEERAFDRLPVLADALEDAGCTDAEILCHCRGGGEHVRGCWVVDLVLGKE
jgi:hypothetical protein